MAEKGKSKIDNAELLARLEAVKPHGESQNSWLRKANVSTSFFTDLRKGSEPGLYKVERLAKQAGQTLADFLRGDERVALGPRLAVKGEVAAGVWREAVELPEDEWVDYTGRGDVTADLAHRFGLRVVGDSMSELYPHGTIVDCVSTFGRAEVRPGKRVVIVRQRVDMLFEATVKELVEIEGVMWARPRSHNPAHQAFRLDDPGPDVVEVRIAAIVVASIRPEE